MSAITATAAPPRRSKLPTLEAMAAYAADLDLRTSAVILADSVSPSGHRLVTLLVTFPRFILAEVNTHRALCLSGDTMLHFDLPGAVGDDTKRISYMSIRDFHDQWHRGSERATVKEDAWSVADVDAKRSYSTRELADLVGADSAHDISYLWRRGQLKAEYRVNPDAPSGRGRLIIEGAEFLRWWEERPRGAYPRRDALQRKLLRSVNEETEEIGHTTVKDVWKSGVKDVFRVTLENGYQIESSRDHLFWTEEGWRTLQEATDLGMTESGLLRWRADAPLIATNGQPALESGEWLELQRRTKTITQIAEEVGCSRSVVFRALKRHGLTTDSPKPPRPAELDSAAWLTEARGRGSSAIAIAEELGCTPSQVKHAFRRFAIPVQDLSAVLSGRTPWNRGMTYALPHRRGIASVPPERRPRGEAHHWWRGGTYVRQGEFQQLARRTHEANGYACVMCGETRTQLHCHHVDPVAHNQERVLDPANLTTLCADCHRQLHHRNLELTLLQEWERGEEPAEFWDRHAEEAPLRQPEWKRPPGNKLVVRWSRIVNIEHVGQQETYDIEVDGPWHNFVADGIVVHNSRNSGSSRAVPVWKTLLRVVFAPYTPARFGVNEPGMQSKAFLTGARHDAATRAHLRGRDRAVLTALEELFGEPLVRQHWGTELRLGTEAERTYFLRTLHFVMRRVEEMDAEARAQRGVLDIHKQYVNRVLEPYAYHEAVLSATEWANWDALRAHPDAQPEIQDLAVAMRDARAASAPRPLTPGRYHAPFLRAEELPLLEEDQHFWAMVAAGRAARTSYLTYDGIRDPQADYDLAASLQQNGHYSPLEHVATPDDDAPPSNFKGWRQLRGDIPYQDNFAAATAARAAATAV